VARVAGAFAEQMRRLGYARYGAQGDDWGSAISRELGARDPEHVVGVHVTMLGTAPGPDDELTDDERARLARSQWYQRELSGDMMQQSARPQTPAYGLHDSPVGQLAWIAEKLRTGPTRPRFRRTRSTGT